MPGLFSAGILIRSGETLQSSVAGQGIVPKLSGHFIQPDREIAIRNDRCRAFGKPPACEAEITPPRLLDVAVYRPDRTGSRRADVSVVGEGWRNQFERLSRQGT